MDLSKKIILVTGANRGIGKALVQSLLKEPITKIYATARNIASLPDFHDNRVIPLTLDITDSKSIQAATLQAQDLNVLFNNAGIIQKHTLLNATKDSLELDMNTNYFGTINVIQAFTPIIEKNGPGLIANTLSIAALAGVSRIAGYSASKAALFSATQSLRAELKPKNIHVHAIFPGPIDTDMMRDLSIPKASPNTTTDNIINAIKQNIEDIFPDPVSQLVFQIWSKDPKSLELRLSSS